MNPILFYRDSKFFFLAYSRVGVIISENQKKKKNYVEVQKPKVRNIYLFKNFFILFIPD
jgi:hypothetical protein